MFAPLLFLISNPVLPAGSGGESHLTGLVLGGINVSALTPAFSGVTTAYTASATAGIESVAVKPSCAAGAVIGVNGVQVASGAWSGQISLGVGANAITITCNAGAADRVYVVTVTRAAGSGVAFPSPTSFTEVVSHTVSNQVVTRILRCYNKNSVSMTISFDPWATPGFAWATVYPVVIPGNSYADFRVQWTKATYPTAHEEVAGGTWSCGAGSGTMSCVFRVT